MVRLTAEQAIFAERSGSAIPRHWPPDWNCGAIAGFAAAGLFGLEYLILAHLQSEPSMVGFANG